MKANPLQELPTTSSTQCIFFSFNTEFVFMTGRYSICVWRAGEDAVRQRTDCTSTNGLVARGGADPDTNRSVGLHSFHGVERDCRPAGLVEFTDCRSDLSMHLREHVFLGRNRFSVDRLSSSGSGCAAGHLRCHRRSLVSRSLGIGLDADVLRIEAFAARHHRVAPPSSGRALG